MEQGTQGYSLTKIEVENIVRLSLLEDSKIYFLQMHENLPSVGCTEYWIAHLKHQVSVIIYFCLAIGFTTDGIVDWYNSQ
jgi:hypothetical protein